MGAGGARAPPQPQRRAAPFVTAPRAAAALSALLFIMLVRAWSTHGQLMAETTGAVGAVISDLKAMREDAIRRNQRLKAMHAAQRNGSGSGGGDSGSGGGNLAGASDQQQQRRRRRRKGRKERAGGGGGGAAALPAAKQQQLQQPPPSPAAAAAAGANATAGPFAVVGSGRKVDAAHPVLFYGVGRMYRHLPRCAPDWKRPGVGCDAPPGCPVPFDWTNDRQAADVGEKRVVGRDEGEGRRGRGAPQGRQGRRADGGAAEGGELRWRRACNRACTMHKYTHTPAPPPLCTPPAWHPHAQSSTTR